MNTLYSYTRTSLQVSLQTSTAFFSLTSIQEWVSGDRAAIAEWSYDVSSDTNGVAYHKVFRQEQLPFAEINQQTEFGNWYYATQSTTGLTHRSGADTVTRQQFAISGVLDNTADANYRSIQDAWPVFAFAEDGVVIRVDSFPAQSTSEGCDTVSWREWGASCTFLMD
jgi:hypothetical protein